MPHKLDHPVGGDKLDRKMMHLAYSDKGKAGGLANKAFGHQAPPPHRMRPVGKGKGGPDAGIHLSSPSAKGFGRGVGGPRMRRVGGVPGIPKGGQTMGQNGPHSGIPAGIKRGGPPHTGKLVGNRPGGMSKPQDSVYSGRPSGGNTKESSGRLFR